MRRRNNTLIIAIAVVIIIAVVIYYNNNKSSGSDKRDKDSSSDKTKTPTFDIHHGTNLVHGQVDPGIGTSDGKISYYGTTPNYEGCRDSCARDAQCQRFTWHEKNNDSDYSQMCYLIYPGANVSPVVEEGHISGVKKETMWAGPNIRHIDQEQMSAGNIYAGTVYNTEGMSAGNINRGTVWDMSAWS